MLYNCECQTMRQRREFSLTETDRARIISLHSSGLSMSEIAIRFGIGTTLVWRVCNRRENATAKPKRVDRGPHRGRNR